MIIFGPALELRSSNDFFYCIGLSCDESGTIIVGSCSKCPYELYFDKWDYYYDYYYENYYNDGTYCSGDCSWNSDLDECQMKGILSKVVGFLKN